MRDLFRALIATLSLLIINIVSVSGEIKYDNVRFKQLEESQKLPHSVIYSITQDDLGFMWFGTRGGLCRYDGYTITTYNHEDGNDKSLRNDYISRLFNDSHNNLLWVVTDNGLCNFNYETESFTNYEIKGNTKVDLFLESTSDGKLLVGCSNGIFTYEKQSDSFVPYLFTEEEFNVNRIVRDKESRLWFRVSREILCYDDKDKTFIDIPKKLEPYSHTISNIIITNSNHLLFTAHSKIYLYDIDRDILINLTKKCDIDEYRCAISDCNGNIWLGAEYGIYVIDREGNKIAHYEQSATDLSALNDSPTYSLYEDVDQNIWVGTFFGGINYFVDGSDQFHIHPYGSSSNHLSGKAVRQIINDNKGGIYIATEDGGINHIDANHNITRYEDIHNKIGIPIKNVHSLLLDGDNLWVGLFRRSVIKYNLRSGRSVNYDRYTPGSSGFGIVKDVDSNIWYGGPGGLFVIEKGASNAQPKRLTSQHIFSMCSINDNTILLGTRRSGILKLDTRTRKLSPANILPAPNIYITYLYKDSKDRVWIGTEHSMLYVIDLNYNTLATYDQQSLGSINIKGIVEDMNGNIWVGTGSGLCRINPESQSVDHYSSENGLPTNQFNYSSACATPDGKLYFGTIDGMISFNPGDVKNSKPHFNIALTGIWSSSEKMSPNSQKEVVPKSITVSDKIILTYDQAKSIRIEYSGLNYQYNQNTIYSMKMDGVETKWQNVDKQHQVRYSNLSPGEYTLHIRASNDGVTWDLEGMKSLKIVVLPPWWQSKLAYATYILLILLAMYLVFVYTKSRLSLEMKLKTTQEQKRYVEEMNRQKIDFFTYVSHDLKTPLTLVLSPLKRLIYSRQLSNNDMGKLEGIYRNANRMQYLIEELLTFSKIEMGQMKINIRKGDIMLLLNELSHMFDVVANDRDIEFIISIPNSGEEVWFSPSKLERIMYNLLSNAFKYTSRGGTITVSATLYKKGDDSFVDISVKDNGRGIPKEMQDKIFDCYYQVDKRDHREGFGLGLSLTKSLIEVHKGSIKVISDVGKGTEFITTLNVSESAYTSSQRSLESITTQDVQKYNQRIKDTLELIPSELSTPVEEISTKDIILIIEDNKEMNNYIAEIFNEKYDVMQAYNGADGFRQMEKKLPDIIICDVMMPVMDGLEFTNRLKNDDNICHIPVILLTAKTDIKDHTEGYEQGAVAYITKPFDAQNLEMLLSNIQKNRTYNIDRFRRSEKVNVNLITTNSRDNKFMNDLIDLVTANISDEKFGIVEVIAHMRISRSLLHTKLKSLSGCSYTQFVRSLKMKEAKRHLSEGMNISETSFSVGISDPNYFTKCFKREFDITPSDFVKQLPSLESEGESEGESEK